MACNRGGVSRVLQKLQKSLDNGDYYEAHQMYRTLHFRYIAQSKYTEAVDLLYNGSLKLLERNQHSSGADLALLLVDVLQRSEVRVVPSLIDKIGTVHRHIDSRLEERHRLASAAIKWTQQKEMPTGHPLLHQLFAVTYWKEHCWTETHYHFIHSTDGAGTAVMLIDHHLTAGYPSEVDLFITQAVLQFLCLRKILTAVKCFQTYTKEHPHVEKGPPFVRPLFNFLWFLLLAVESGKLAVFTVLCETYNTSIKRDPAYRGYLDRIGQLFFGVPKPQTQQQPGGLFGNLLQSLIGDEGSDHVEPMTSQSHSPTMSGVDLD